MKIALVCPYAWDLPGGVQVHVRELAARLRDRGHEATVLAPSLGPIEEPGVTMAGRAMRIRYQGTVAPIAPGSYGAVRRALRTLRPDLVHAHEPLVPSSSMAAAMTARCPVVATFHAHAERAGIFDLSSPLLRPVWRRLRVRIAVSETARSFVGTRMGDGVRVIPNGVDVPRFSGAEPAGDLPPGPRILWVGRLDPQKGFPVAVRSFEMLARKRADVALVVAGEGRDLRALDRVPSDVRRRVILLGTVGRDALPRYHAAADVFVSPAVGQESFGIVLVEAMAAGLPVVATDIPGYREVVDDGVEGLMVDPGDPVALADALGRVLSDHALATSLGQAGRKRARRYDWGTVVGQIEEAYREAVDGT